MVKKIIDNMNKVIVGKDVVGKLLLTAALSGGHVLMEDVPGVGKTTFALALSKSIGGSFARIQFTPDTMPGDVTGSSVYNYETKSFNFIKGPVMNNFVLADEINRTSPKTQASLLEAMEEGSVSADGVTYELPKPFMVIATQNPIALKGTYYLPEAQLDRFMMRVSVGYPGYEDELQIVKNMLAKVSVKDIAPVVTAEEFLKMMAEVEQVEISDNLIEYATLCVEETRKHEKVELGASPRALLSWIKAARAWAYVQGRTYVTPDDLKFLAPYVLGHRLIATGHATRNINIEKEIIDDILRKVKVPLGE